MAHVISFICFLSLLVTIAVIFRMKYSSAASLAQMRVDQDESLRALTAKSVEAQAQAATALAAMTSELAEIKTRLAAVEKILRQVE